MGRVDRPLAQSGLTRGRRGIALSCPGPSTPARRPPMLKLFRQKLLVPLVLALVVYVATRLGLALGIGPGRVSAAWPTAGLALALLMVVGRRAIAGLALGLFCANWFLFVGAAVGFDARSALASLV